MHYPWQQEQWQRLQHARQAKRLPHALLFAGLAGTGKVEFAQHFAQALLCQQIQAQGYACNTCHACRLIETRAHPNVLWIEPEKEGQAIKVDQIRNVSEFVNQSSLQGEHRIVIINPASDMNTNAANALLKTLEEPSAGAMLILICDQLSALPATVLSRCQHIHFACPPSEQVKPWLTNQIEDKTIDIELLLRLANGAPLAAIELFKNDILPLRQSLYQLLSQPQLDPIKASNSLQDLDVLQFLDFMLLWIMDILRLQLGANTNELTNIDYQQPLNHLKTTTQVTANTRLMDYLQKCRTQISVGINLNKTLVMESILIRWLAGFESRF